MLEKAKTRSIGHGSDRDDYVLRVQAKAKPLRDIGSSPVYPFWCALFFYLRRGCFVPQPTEGYETEGLMTRGEHPPPRPADDEGG